MSEPCPHELEVGAYLLGSQTHDEARAFEAHVPGCERCQQDVARLRMAADALGASVPPVAPPPELKQRVMAVVRSEARPEIEAESEPGWRRLLAPPRLAWAVALAAAALLIGGLAGYALRPTGEDVRVLQADVDRAAAPGASARLIIRGDDATLRIRGLRNPARGRVYQVWVTRPGDRAPRPTNGLFVARSDRTAVVQVPADPDELDQVLVTAEPPGGSPAPTASPIIAARVQ